MARLVLTLSQNQNTWDQVSFYYLGHGESGHIEGNLKGTVLLSFVVYIGRCISLSNSKSHLMAQLTRYIALTTALMFLMPNDGRAGGLSSLNNVLSGFGVTVVTGYFAIALSKRFVPESLARRLLGVAVGSLATIAMFAVAEDDFSSLSPGDSGHIAAWAHLIGLTAGLAFEWAELVRSDHIQKIENGIAEFLDLFSDKNLRHDTTP